MEPADAVALCAVALHAFIFKVKAAAGAFHHVMGTVSAAPAHVKLCHDSAVALFLYKLNSELFNQTGWDRKAEKEDARRVPETARSLF